MKEKVGLYSGTFDPIHEGHVSFALAALGALDLHQVILLPERQPRGKSPVNSFETRCSEVRSVLAGYPQLDVKSLRSKQHTVKTVIEELGELLGRFEVTFLLGSDVAKSLHAWEGIATLLQNHKLCIGLRGDETEHSIRPFIRSLERTHGLQADVTYVATGFKHVSSTAVRQQAKQP